MSHLSGRVHLSSLASLQKERGVDPGARIINSVLEEDVAVATGAVVQHCHLKVKKGSCLPTRTIGRFFWDQIGF